MTKTFLIWDLGATKCGIAKIQLTDHTTICEEHISLPLADFASLDDLVDALENQLKLKHEEVDRILIAGAGSYDGYVLENANPYPFRMDFARLAFERHWPGFEVVHDYVPVLCSTFTPYIFDPKYVKTLLSGVRDPAGRHVVFGVGTGLGLKDGALLDAGQLFVGNNEAGHLGISFPPLAGSKDRMRHEKFLNFLFRTVDGSVTFETILSGAGLVRVHNFCTGESLSPEAVSALLNEGRAESTAALFAWYLGLFVAVVQLVFMPTGGIWMTGGVLCKNPMLVDRPELFKGMNAHPAYQNVRDKFPLGFIFNHELAYLGGAWYAALSP